MSRFERIQTTLGILQLLGLVVGTIFVVVQLRQASEQLEHTTNQIELTAIAQKTTIEMDRRSRALEFIKRFNTEPIITIRSRAAGAIMQGKHDEEPGMHDVQAYLNFYEEMAMAVLNDLAHEEICYLFFRRPLNFLCGKCDDFLRKDSNTYIHLKTLNDKWKTRPKKIDPLEVKP